MGKLKSWGVKCPEDYATNSKWNTLKKYFEKSHDEEIIFPYGYDYHIGVDLGGIITWWTSRKRFDKILTIDEAHSMLFDNVITEKPILTDYQKLRNAGFERQTIEDQVYFDVHGQNPFLMVKKLAKETKMVWNSVDNSIELMVINKDGGVMFRKALELDEVVG